MGELFLYLPEAEDFKSFLKPLLKMEVFYKSSVFQWEDLEDPVGGEVFGGISHVLEYLFTLASTWPVSCLQIQSLEKLSKSRSQCSVKLLASAHFFWSAQNRFSDVSLLLLKGAKQVRPLICGRSPHFSAGNEIYFITKVPTPRNILSDNTKLLILYTKNILKIVAHQKYKELSK